MATKKSKSAKIKYTALVATSIDGRIAEGARSGTDWTSAEDWKYFQSVLSKSDAVIAGFNTYKVAEAGLKKRNTIVLTSKADKLKSQGSVIFLNPKKSNLKNFLQSKNYKNVAIVGGALVYNFCLENKIMDEIFVTIEPYIFTNGVPMFAGAKFKKHQFILVSAKKLNKKGTFLLRYKRKEMYGN
ncbi:MAG TPA: dihydrofolate reductase [Candidatus Paceibacterota bacterium]